MNYTILSLDNILGKAKKLVDKIQVDDLQKRWDKFVKTTTDSINASYFDQIEMLTFKMKDMEEANNRITLINAELQAKLESTYIRDNRFADTQEELNQAYREIAKLKSDLEIEIGNRNHFRQLISDNDNFMAQLKVKINSDKAVWKKEFDDLKAQYIQKNGEAEHLAKQAIRLTEENTNFRQGITELTHANEELTALNSQLNTQTPLLMAENEKYRDQTVRLVEEKRCLQEQVNEYMGIAKETAERLAHQKNTAKNLEDSLAEEKEINNLRINIIYILTDVITKLGAMPWYAWIKKKELLATYKDRVNVSQSKLDAIKASKSSQAEQLAKFASSLDTLYDEVSNTLSKTDKNQSAETIK